jgi:hypothetical protein
LNSQDGGKIFTSEEDTMGSRMVMVTNKGYNAYCTNLNNNQPQTDRYAIILSDRRGYRYSTTEIMTTSNNELKQGEVPGNGSKAELGTTIVVTPWLGGGVTANDLGPNCLANAPPAHAHTR